MANILETSRLSLRPITLSDRDAFIPILGCPDVMQYSMTGAMDKEQISTTISNWMASYDQYGFGPWALIYEGKLIGYAGLDVRIVEEQERTQITFRLAKEYWGKGMATEVAVAVRDYAFGSLQKEEIIAIVDPENTASIHTITKIGMVFEKAVIYGGLSLHVYKIVQDKTICEAYEQIASWFDQARSKHLMEKEYLQFVLKHVKPGSHILDLGCGTGEPIARFFIENGMKVTGIDGAASMIAMCKERFPAMQWQLGCMRTIDLKKQFDAVIAWDSFFHLTPDEQRAMFAIFKKHLTPGGILVFTAGRKYGEVYGTMDGHRFYHASLDSEEYRKLLAEHGFTLLLHKVEDPDCGEHTVWVAAYEPSMPE